MDEAEDEYINKCQSNPRAQVLVHSQVLGLLHLIPLAGCQQTAATAHLQPCLLVAGLLQLRRTGIATDIGQDGETSREKKKNICELISQVALILHSHSQGRTRVDRVLFSCRSREGVVCV